MAQQKEARVVETIELSPTTRVLHLAPLERLDFVGGQYLIFNSGIALPDGKLAKRAYSILSPDANQDEITIAVKDIDGPGSRWMHERAAGDVVPFSGPWGKWLADDATPRRTLVLATDTGITAALGLINGAAFAPQRARCRLVWLVERDDYFLPDAFVRAALPDGVTLVRAPIPAPKHPERVAAAELASDGEFDSVFLAGDGDVVYALRDKKFSDARIECFFHNPAKKSA